MLLSRRVGDEAEARLSLRYASAAFCSPSRASLLLSRPVFTTGLRHHDQAVARGRYFVPGAAPLPERFKASGRYAVLGAGKLWHSNGPARAERASWDDYFPSRACAFSSINKDCACDGVCYGALKATALDYGDRFLNRVYRGGPWTLDDTPSPDDALVAWGVERLAAHRAARERAESESESAGSAGRRRRRGDGGGGALRQAAAHARAAQAARTSTRRSGCSTRSRRSTSRATASARATSTTCRPARRGAAA